MSAAHAEAGHKLGRYELVERLGIGGMAEVWKARVVGPQGFVRTVVVKRVLPHLVQDPDFVRLFIAEARLSARLTHSNVVQVFELGETNGEYFIAMEYVRGRDLIALLRTRAAEGPMPIGGAAFVIREVCRALDYVHNLSDDEGRPLRLVHRDVSPSNVMIGFDGAVKLLDFGIAKALAEVNEHRTATGTLKGKFAYMAPEQIEGKPIDHRADLFAAGIMLHETLTNRRLFKGASDLQTLTLARDANVGPPSKKNSAVPPELDEICLKALARTPRDRYATCGELARALDDIVYQTKWSPEQMAALMRETFGAGAADTGSLPRLEPMDVAGSHVTVPAVKVSSTAGVVKVRQRVLFRRVLSAAALAAVVVVVATWRASRRPGDVAPAASASAAPRLRSPAPSAEVAITISSLPLGADIFFDGETTARGRTPLTVRLPRGDGKKHIRLVRAGYGPSSTDVAMTADAQVQLALVKTQRRPSSQKVTKRPATGMSNGALADPFSSR